MRELNRFILLGLLSLCLAFPSQFAHAAAGNLDTSFGKGGVTVTTLTTPGGSNGVLPFSVQLQSDGKILVLADVLNGASASTDVLRYTSTGVLDTTFGNGGIAVLPMTLAESSMAIQPNGQIVVAGNNVSAFTAERLNTNGTIDASFGSNGVASASLNGRFPGTQLVVMIETSGNILVVGQLEPTGRREPFQTFLARFTSAGALDNSFGANGSTLATAVGGCTALAELSNGNILVVNRQEIAQFTSTGSLESTVPGGSIIASAGSSFPSPASLFQPDGDFLLGEMVFVGEESRARNGAVQVQRFASNGAAGTAFADPTFHFAGTGGSGIEASPGAMAVQPNGDIVIVGGQSTLTQTGATTVNGLARITPSGILDSTFGTNGTVTNSVPAGTQGLVGVTIQLDGRIVAIGLANDSAALTVSRYLGQ